MCCISLVVFMWKCKVLLGKNKLQISVPLAAIDALCFYVDFVKSSTLVYSLLLNSRGKKIVQLFLSIVVFHDWILFTQHLSFLILFIFLRASDVESLSSFSLFLVPVVEANISIFWSTVDFPIHYAVPVHGTLFLFFFCFFICCLSGSGYIRKKCKGCSSY